MQLKHTIQNLKKAILNIVFIITVSILLVSDDLREIVINTLSDAFWQVSVYVAITLALYDFLSKKVFTENNFFTFKRFPLILSSFLGSLPGCGGAIVVMTKFIQGHLSFGCVVTVLTSTMGDAAFLLLARKPKDGFVIIIIGFVIGIISGAIIDRFHRKGFMMPNIKEIDSQNLSELEQVSKTVQSESFFSKIQNTMWKWILGPSLVITLLGSFQFDANSVLHLPSGSIEVLGAGLAVICMFVWNIDYISKIFLNKSTDYADTLKVGNNTNFVLCWVAVSFLLFELGIHFTGFDLGILFKEFESLTPLIAILIGLLPGCGPQILVTTFYIADIIPFSAQLGNSLSNDGDALFPALAFAPKAALLATVYSAVPAFICAYSYRILFELY